jgi:hypothetical protein
MHDGHRRLLFAGEHASMPWFGYMEGALQSGLRAAHKIAALVGVPQAVELSRKRHADSARQRAMRAGPPAEGR